MTGNDRDRRVGYRRRKICTPISFYSLDILLYYKTKKSILAQKSRGSQLFDISPYTSTCSII